MSLVLSELVAGVRDDLNRLEKCPRDRLLRLIFFSSRHDAKTIGDEKEIFVFYFLVGGDCRLVTNGADKWMRRGIFRIHHTILPFRLFFPFFLFLHFVRPTPRERKKKKER